MSDGSVANAPVLLTDKYAVPLALTTVVTSLILAIVFGIWYSREGTLSIHGIETPRREAFYWLALLITFALGTAAGDWTLELTGWTPGVAVLLPIALIASIVVGWRFGANPVLSFWLAYILTRPLGANLGDWLALDKTSGGLGLGTAMTSVIFLAAILATVIYLVVRRPDVIENRRESTAVVTNPARERTMLGYYVAVALVAAGVLTYAHHQPHQSVAAEGPTGPVVQLTPQQATANFPLDKVTEFRAIAQDTLDLVNAGDQAGAVARVKDLETAWDDAQPTLEPMDGTAWTFIDSEIDGVLTSVRAPSPDPTAERDALTALIASLSA